jgi:alkanesulfonate monooxygenase SsuD/methylene tetrahydromethanopterin reductase-like flavin-dependent oxidoreductase (luciferase family)
LGFDSVWVADHILSGESSGLYEPLTTLSVLCGSTDEINLGTSVLIASLRSPVLLADVTGTIQEASDGRLILGVGTGWDRHEFESLGVMFEERGAITDECLEIMRGLWKGEALSFQGTHFDVKDVKIGTAPGQLPPIWIGGNSRAAIRRAAMYNAWFPTDPTIEEISEGELKLTRLVKTSDIPMVAAHIYLILGDTTREAERDAMFLSEQAGDTLSGIKQWAIVGNAETAGERIGNYMDAGVRYFVFSLPYIEKYEALLDRIMRFAGQL